VLLLSPAVPLYAVPANVLVAPAVAPATVGGLLAALLGGWWPAAATWCAQVAWVGGPVGPLLLAGASAAALVLVLRCRRGVAP
jgi:competence protein ComEC